jgi:hypothetical protein
MGISLTPEEQFEIFGTDKLGEHQEEGRQRWGDTGARPFPGAGRRRRLACAPGRFP